MPKLSVSNFGTDVAGIRLYGDKTRALEPSEVRIAFPGGDVTVARTTAGDYWVHVRVNKDDDVIADEDLVVGHVTDGRFDIEGMSVTDADTGDLAHPDLYHLAVRVTR